MPRVLLVTLSLAACSNHGTAEQPRDDAGSDAAPIASDASGASVDAAVRPDANLTGNVEGVARADTFAAITDADAQALCRWNNAEKMALSPSLEDSCTFAAAASTDSASACQAQVSACVIAGSLSTTTSDCSAIRAAGIPASCGTIYVGEYADCVDDTYNAQKALLNGVTCASAGMVTATMLARAESCAALADTCRVLLP